MSGQQNPLLASMLSELPGSSRPAADSLRSRVAAMTPVITIDRTQRLFEQGTEFTCFEVTVSVSEHSWMLQKRYSEFEELYRHLFAAHSKVVAAERWPSFPQKTWLSRFDQAIVETRRQGLQVFLQACVARTLYPVILDTRLRGFLLLDEGIEKAVELEHAKAAEAAAASRRAAAAKARMQLEAQRKRNAHAEAIRRERARHKTGTASCVGASSTPRVTCGVVVATPLVEAHRRYAAAVLPPGAHGNHVVVAKEAAWTRFSLLCAVWGIQPYRDLSPSVEMTLTGSTSYPTQDETSSPVGLAGGVPTVDEPTPPTVDEPTPDSATRETDPTTPSYAPAPVPGTGCCECGIAGAVGLLTVCAAAGIVVAAGDSVRGGSLSARVSAIRRLSSGS